MDRRTRDIYLENSRKDPLYTNEKYSLHSTATPEQSSLLHSLTNIYIYIHTMYIHEEERKRNFLKITTKFPPSRSHNLFKNRAHPQQKEGKNHGKRARTLESRALLYTTKASTKNTHEGYAIPVSVDERSDVRMRTPTLGGCAWAYVRAHTCARR